jgi:hypothetical protein
MDIAIERVVAGFSPRSFCGTECALVNNRTRAEARDYVPDAKSWSEMVKNPG